MLCLQGAPIKIDEVDSLPPNPDQSIKHIGPIETKIIRGTDNRTYLLELMRITPRDANFVPVSIVALISSPDSYHLLALTIIVAAKGYRESI